MQKESYRVQLEDIFEGPMDLLVHLIKKNELDIYDIPIAMVTDQYLQYLEWIKIMNIDFAGEFIVLASTLAQIKSRMLLPAAADEEEEDDPRQEIIRPLIEYLQMKSAAEQLSERHILGEATFVRSGDHRDFLGEEDEPYVQVGLFELIDAFQKILAKIPGDLRLEFTPDKISVKEKITQITDILEARGSVTFDELFSERPDKAEVIVTFLAVLEMVKLTLIRIAQHAQTGVLRLFYV
ncbi:MAG: segregation/condensation protein A [Deltaproteobacteria bacterium]|jgi:segregation and condensation protein A|nr:segregation/condensation protein A [Deltaproteobacteria bacterium]